MLSFNQLGRLGRLGNQMFQYAVLLAEARRLGLPHCIPESSGIVADQQHQLLEAFELPELTILGRQRAPRRLALPIDRGWAPGWNDRVGAGIDLVGFFQSERFFSGQEGAVRTAFAFHPPRRLRCEAALARIGPAVIALHVRRTDYLANTHRFPPCGLGYFGAALALMPEDLPVLVLSDDIAWCRAQPAFAGRRFVFSHAGSNIDDLCLMSLCSHHVISNSSFSWWGAWLASHPGQRVVAPRDWFGAAASPAKQRHITPPHWLRLPNQG
jgi:hypothetical protein